MSERSKGGWARDVPKRVTDDEKGDVLLVCVVQDGVAVGLDHVPIGEEDGFVVERFLGANEDDQGERRWSVDESNLPGVLFGP